MRQTTEYLIWIFLFGYARFKMAEHHDCTTMSLNTFKRVNINLSGREKDDALPRYSLYFGIE